MNGTALRDAREQHGWTTTAFSKKAKISRDHLNEVEKGRRQPSRMWVYHVADELGVPFTAFCDEVDDEEADAA